LKHKVTRNPAVAREYALQSIQFLLQYWPSKLSKVDNLHLIWKGVCHFLLVINSNLNLISHCFRDIASFSLKTHIFLPFLFKFKFKNVLLELHPPNCVNREPRHRTNYSCKKFSPMTWGLVSLHLLQTNGQTEGQTDDNRAIDALYSVAVARQKSNEKCNIMQSFVKR